MDLERFKNFIKGKYSSHELEEFEKKLFSEEGENLIEHLFDEFQFDESIPKEEEISAQLLDKIHSKLYIEELIKEISNEHKKHERLLDKSRKPLSGVYRKNILKRGAFAGIVLVAFAIALAVNFSLKGINVSLEDKAPEINYINKSTGKGQKLTIHLADGSKVILNSKSSIEYPEVFSDSIREVKVEGEAFFDVAHNKEKPFVVHAGNLKSKVLGTSFNIQYRPEDDINAVALVSGKVQVSLDQERDQKNSFLLAPGELMKINTEGTLQKQKFNIEREIGWKDNVIFFTDANYDEVFSTLEDWFGVEMELIGSSREIKWNLTAKFENENLRNILDALSLSQGIQYELNEKIVIIKF